MTISLNVSYSHKYSYSDPFKSVFKLTLVPERLSPTRGFHYIIAMDTSGSMAGDKIELAKKGAEEYVKTIPEGNRFTFITFSDQIKVLKEYSESRSLSDIIPMITVGGETKLYTAIQTACQIASKHEVPGWLILITDGEPTDVTNSNYYKNLKVSKGFEMLEFGIGSDYNEEILKILADATGGKLYHISDPSEIPSSLEKNKIEEVSAKEVIIDIESEVAPKILNYPNTPIRINAVSDAVKILGESIVSSNFSGVVLKFDITYEDPVDSMKKSITKSIEISPAKDKELFLSEINKSLISEYSYYLTLEKYYEDLKSGNIKEATKTMNFLKVNAEQTKKPSLIETTKVLSTNLEQTIKLGVTADSTKDLRKQVASEVTKKTRGES